MPEQLKKHFLVATANRVWNGLKSWEKGQRLLDGRTKQKFRGELWACIAVNREGGKVKEETKGISSKSMSDLNILAIRAIGMVQCINVSPGPVDTERVTKSLDEIVKRAKLVREEIDKSKLLGLIGYGPGGMV